MLRAEVGVEAHGTPEMFQSLSASSIFCLTLYPIKYSVKQRDIKISLMLLTPGIMKALATIAGQFTLSNIEPKIDYPKH